jgi:hypothetical protein
MNTTLFGAFGYLIFEKIYSNVNEELFNNMQIKIQKIREAKLILDNLEE